jgi:cytosine/adenosine deaminase-related metal-dependent hydrolase
MLAQMRLSLYLARLREGRADACLPADALRRATAGGASCIGRPDLGRLEVGATADLAVWPVRDVADFADPVEGLVLGPGRQPRFRDRGREPCGGGRRDAWCGRG